MHCDGGTLDQNLWGFGYAQFSHSKWGLLRHYKAFFVVSLRANVIVQMLSAITKICTVNCRSAVCQSVIRCYFIGNCKF